MHIDTIGMIIEGFFVADLKYIIGAAHATEIPLITGNNKLVGEYGFFYILMALQRFTSKNMAFWANFAKMKTRNFFNGIKWEKYNVQTAPL